MGIWPPDDQIIHMVGLIKKHCGLAPGHDFIAPVSEFWCDYRVNIGTRWYIPHELNRVLGRIEQVLE